MRDTDEVCTCHKEKEEYFYGVLAPSWVFNDSLCAALRAQSKYQESDRSMALLLTAADRIERLEKLIES